MHDAKSAPTATIAKQQDDAMMEALHHEDLERERLNSELERMTNDAVNLHREQPSEPDQLLELLPNREPHERDQPPEPRDEGSQVLESSIAPAIPPRSLIRRGPGARDGRANSERRRIANS